GMAVRTDGAIIVSTDANISSALQGGVYRSTDAGASCPFASHGISAFRVRALAAAGPVYMGDWRSGAYRSDDGGVTRSGASGGLSGIELIVHDFAVDPSNASALYMTSGNTINDRVWKSGDAGGSWTSTFGPYPLFQSIAIDPVNADRVFLGMGGFQSNV